MVPRSVGASEGIGLSVLEPRTGLLWVRQGLLIDCVRNAKENGEISSANALRSAWNAGNPPHLGSEFLAIQKAATIRFCSAFIRGIPVYIS